MNFWEWYNTLNDSEALLLWYAAMIVIVVVVVGGWYLVKTFRDRGK